MKKIVSILLLLVVGLIKADTFQIPLDVNGKIASDLSFSGVRYQLLSQTTVPALVRPSTSTTGGGRLFGVLVSSADANRSIVFRDSGTANITSTMLMPPVIFPDTQTAKLVWFDPPFRYANALSANLSNSDIEASVFYLPDGDYFRYRIPRDTRGKIPGVVSVRGTSSQLIDHTTVAALVRTSTATATADTLLYNVDSSTASAQEYIIFRDSTTANTTSAKALPPIGTRRDENTGINFPYPIRFSNAISGNVTSYETGVTTSAARYTIRYRHNVGRE